MIEFKSFKIADKVAENIKSNIQSGTVKVFNYETGRGETEVEGNGIVEVYISGIKTNKDSNIMYTHENTIHIDCYGFGKGVKEATETAKNILQIVYQIVTDSRQQRNAFGLNTENQKNNFVIVESKVESILHFPQEKNEGKIAVDSYRIIYRVNTQELCYTEPLGVKNLQGAVETQGASS